MKKVLVGFVCQLHEMAAAWKLLKMVRASGGGGRQKAREDDSVGSNSPHVSYLKPEGGVNYATCISRGIESLGGRHCSERR